MSLLACWVVAAGVEIIKTTFKLYVGAANELTGFLKIYQQT